MSDNVERVEAIFEAFGRGDVPFILDNLTDDVRFASYLDPSVPWAGEFVGKERVMEFFQAIGGAIEVTGHPVDAIVADGETVYSRGSSTFNVRATGKAEPPRGSMSGRFATERSASTNNSTIRALQTPSVDRLVGFDPSNPRGPYPS